LDGLTAFRFPPAEAGLAAGAAARFEPSVVPVREAERLGARWFATKRCPYVECARNAPP
jgi:hypothetical protein